MSLLKEYGAVWHKEYFMVIYEMTCLDNVSCYSLLFSNEKENSHKVTTGCRPLTYVSINSTPNNNYLQDCSFVYLVLQLSMDYVENSSKLCELL